MFIPRHGGRSKKPAPVPSPENDTGTANAANEDALTDSERKILSRAEESLSLSSGEALNLALDDDAPLGDADDCLYLALSAGGITEIDPVTGSASTNRATTGNGTVASPMLVPFTGTGIFMPGPSHTFGVFSNRVGYGSNRWLPVDPGRPIQASQGKLALAIITAGGITPSGLLVLQYYKRPAGISWARWGKRVKESAHGYAISPLPASSSGAAVQPVSSSLYRYQFKNPGDNLPVAPPAKTIETNVWIEGPGANDNEVGAAVGDILAGNFALIPAGNSMVVTLPGTGTFEWQDGRTSGAGVGDIAVAQFLIGP